MSEKVEQKSPFDYKDLAGTIQILTPKDTYTVDYPQAVKASQEQARIIWFAEELGVEKDEDDIRTKCSEGERHGITTVLKLFTNYECVDSETEVLTPNGWKYIGEIDPKEKIAQWCPETKEVSFVVPERMFSKHYNGMMYHIHDTWRHVNQLVTPNHRVVYKTPKVGEYRFKTAEKMNFHQFNSIPVSGFISGEKKQLSFVERFLIASQADGSYKEADEGHYNKKLDGYRVTFGFSKERKIERFEWILENLGWEYEKKIRKFNDSRNPLSMYRVVVPYWAVQNSESFKNFSAWVNLDGVDSNWCNEFLDEVAEWDGSRIHENNIDYRTTVKENSDFVQALLPLAGRFGTIRVQVDGRKETFSDIYYLQYRADIFEKSGQHIKKSEVEYDGMVYCPTVPTGAFIIRREGTVGITGNCLLGGDEFWGGKVTRMFPRPEIQRMSSTFSFIELGVHAIFYDLINKALNIATDEFYSSWKKDPILTERMEFIGEFAEENCPLISTAAFAFMEGAVLFSNFAFLKSFNSGGHGLIPHITAGIDASAKD